MVMTINLTLEQRARLMQILPTYPSKPVGRKRADTLLVFEGILWVLLTGARWDDIDKRRFAARQTCQRYFTDWVAQGVFQKAVETLVKEMAEEGLIKLHESFLDDTFVEAKKGAQQLAGLRQERVPK